MIKVLNIIHLSQADFIYLRCVLSKAFWHYDSCISFRGINISVNPQSVNIHQAERAASGQNSFFADLLFSL